MCLLELCSKARRIRWWSGEEHSLSCDSILADAHRVRHKGQGRPNASTARESAFVLCQQSTHGDSSSIIKLARVMLERKIFTEILILLPGPGGNGGAKCAIYLLRLVAFPYIPHANRERLLA